MAKKQPYHLEIEIDGLTNSVRNTISGDSFPTEVLAVTKADLKLVTKVNGWKFDWKSELKQTDRQLYKLTITGNPDILQGLVSISDYSDHFYLHLVESAPYNLGKRNYMKAFRVTCLPLPANFPGTKATMKLWHFNRKHG